MQKQGGKYALGNLEEYLTAKVEYDLQSPLIYRLTVHFLIAFSISTLDFFVPQSSLFHVLLAHHQSPRQVGDFSIVFNMPQDQSLFAFS